jgi:hypothetical protein
MPFAILRLLNQRACAISPELVNIFFLPELAKISLELARLACTLQLAKIRPGFMLCGFASCRNIDSLSDFAKIRL